MHLPLPASSSDAKFLSDLFFLFFVLFLVFFFCKLLSPPYSLGKNTNKTIWRRLSRTSCLGLT